MTGPMTGSKLATAAVALAIAVIAACARDNSLEGSVDQLFPLGVSQVQLLRNEQAFQASYYANRGADIDLVARITVYVADTGLDAGQTIPLAGEWSPGHARTSVVHLAAGEAERVFPNVKRGELTIQSGGGIDQFVRGEFGVLFEDGDQYGSGRTLNGTFAAVARDAGYDTYLPSSGDPASP